MDLVARADVVIDAPAKNVWQILMAPETAVRILPITEVLAPWRVGEPFLWMFTLADKVCRVEGFVFRATPDELLEFEYQDAHSREVRGIHDHVHRVKIQLNDAAGKTHVTLTQDANLGETETAHAAGGWRLALHRLKWAVETAAAEG